MTRPFPKDNRSRTLSLREATETTSARIARLQTDARALAAETEADLVAQARRVALDAEELARTGCLPAGRTEALRRLAEAIYAGSDNLISLAGRRGA